jgi:hypothetical protein
MKWIKGKDSPRVDLQAQLAAATSARERAWAEVATAQEAFDLDGSPSSEKALLAARAEAERADLHLERADRLLRGHDEVEAERKRAAVEARILEITKRLSRPSLDAMLEPLAKRQAELLLQLADVLTERAVQHHELKELVWERFKLRQQLGETPTNPAFTSNEVPSLDTRERVVTALLSEARKLGDRAPRREVLNKMIEQHGGTALPEPRVVGGAA